MKKLIATTILCQLLALSLQAYQTTTTHVDQPVVVTAQTKDQKNANDQFKTENDKHLNNKIRDQITGWFTDKYKEVILRTNNGIVTIEGFVYSIDDQKQLNDEIKKVDGVKSVNNATQVKTK